MSLTIPGLPAFMVHERAEWERPHQRVATWVHNGKVYVAPKGDLARVDANADHWPGTTSPTIDTSTNAKTIARLQSSQNYYVTQRGYSIGYNFAIDQRGHVWELRGFGFRCAANSSHNTHALAVQHLLGADQEPSPEMINSSRLVHKESARRCGRATTPWTPTSGWWISGHNDLRQYPPLAGRGTPTGCCGPAMYRLLHTEPVGRGGELHPNKLDTEEDSDMKAFPARRLLDTRAGRNPSDPKYDEYKAAADSTHTIKIDEAAGCQAAQITVTITDAAAPGFLTTWPGGARPNTSFSNPAPGHGPDPETLFVRLASDGSFQLYTLESAHVIIDFTGIALT